MSDNSGLERRKARTRAALIAAAQGFIANGKLNAPILEITQAAEVANGSFYNHFESKEDLWRAAVDTALDSVGDYLDSLTVDLTDPVEMFTQSFRLAGRLFRLEPQMSRVLLSSEAAAITSDHGLAPRSRRDIEAAAKQGRFDVDDPDRALALVAGAFLAMGRMLLDQPDRDEAPTVDGMTADILRALGIPATEAKQLCARPLPQFFDVGVRRVVDPAAQSADPSVTAC
ncbi:TetR/AcrR family transcriptional regulator [Rhodococcus tibetensis]|uniref:TetR/AcrR family transcriptional regulator n=1 Tax=Rhodococcus tibetensis TaxID=2965064 RepID=A0ABT1QFG8_9NOCA|nr:TetR/AcrR family transcriptional regulator [Rhodococcus sp. FXJ9.536]MCQ4121034.1 TetR/AcrR family transcriptional regulator [Rhodococcus sp. FXJ9.536]